MLYDGCSEQLAHHWEGGGGLFASVLAGGEQKVSFILNQTVRAASIRCARHSVIGTAFQCCA